MSEPSIVPTPAQDDPPVELLVVESTPADATATQTDSKPSLVADSESSPELKETTIGTQTEATSLFTIETLPLEKIISRQPTTIPNLSITEAAPPKAVRDRLAKRPSAFRRFRPRLHGVNEGLYNIFLACRIVLFYWIPGAILFIIVGALMVGLSFGSIAADGAISFLTGNAILRAAGFPHYTDNASAATIGAVGILLAGLCVGALTQWIPVDENGRAPWYITMPLSVLTMTLAGVIGTSLLHRHHVDIGDIDILHAARAGALGGAVVGVALLLAGPVILLVLGILLSPLWLAMSLGFRWVYGRSSEVWTENYYRSSYCYTYGSCGDDPEIEAELQEFRQQRFRSTRSHF